MYIVPKIRVVTFPIILVYLSIKWVFFNCTLSWIIFNTISNDKEIKIEIENDTIA